MSLSLTRRMAKTALLIAAGAAPLVGMAPAANAVVLPQTDALGKLSQLDAPSLSDSVGKAALGTQIALETTKDAALGTHRSASDDRALKAKAMELAGHTSSKSAKQAPKDADDRVMGLLGATAKSAASNMLPTDELPFQDINLGGLPLDTLT